MESCALPVYISMLLVYCKAIFFCLKQLEQQQRQMAAKIYSRCFIV